MSEFDRIIGYQSTKYELQRLCDIIKNPEKYNKLGVSFPRGIVLHGEPGVGKTLMANCFIKESGINYYVCRKDKPDGEFINSIRATFEEAKKNQPAIVLLDDVDKFANEDDDHKDAQEYVAVQACIDDAKEDKVFVFATANELSKIPDSLLRAGRFDKSVWISRPTGKEAKDIIKYYLGKKQYVDDINIDELVRILEGRSCAELESIINDAGIYAGFENKEKIEKEDVIRACLRFIYNAPETIVSEDGHFDDEEIAYHEAGHAVVSEVLEPGSVTIVSIGGYEGDISGFTASHRDSAYWRSYQLMRNRILTLLAGKAAVELHYGRHDVGCSQDLTRATDVVRRMVSEYGIVGFNKRNAGERFYLNSEELNGRIEDATFDELEKCYMQTKELLCKNAEFVDNVVKAVLQKKLLTSSEIQEIKKNCNVGA